MTEHEHPERLCVNCGKTARVARGTFLPECTSPDGMAACTFDMTAEEAWQYWRQRYHDEYSIVGRCWKALEVNKYDGGPPIWDRISTLREEVVRLRAELASLHEKVHYHTGLELDLLDD